MPTLMTALASEQVMNRLRAHAEPQVRRNLPYRDRDTFVIRTDGDRFWLKFHAARHGRVLRHRADILCGRVLPTENGCAVRYHIRKSIPMLFLGTALAVCFLPLFSSLVFVAARGRPADIGGLIVTGGAGICGLWLLLRSGARPLRQYLYAACKKE